jgi:hypothetical protein
MRKAYVVISIVVLALATASFGYFTLHPPQQHGRGMGAALLSAYVALAWLAALVNTIAATLLFLCKKNRPRPRCRNATGRNAPLRAQLDR